MDKSVRIGLYRILRKLRVRREDIYEDAQLKNNLIENDIEWNCLLFFIESRFEMQISKNQENSLITVGNTIDFIKNAEK